MISNSKKLIILMLSLTVSLFNACSNNNASNAEKLVETSKISLNNQLIKTSNWKKLGTIWKQINKLESSNDQTFPSDQYKELTTYLPEAKSSINALYDNKLLSEEEKEFLITIISQRVSYLEYKLGFISCYDMTQLGFEIIKHRDDLENRYDILEKLFKENKIGSEAFELTKQKINEDIIFIEQNEYSSSKKEYNKDLTNLLIYLNR